MAVRHALVGTARVETSNGAGTLPTVITAAGLMYLFFIDSATSDPAYVKSSDGGVSWSAEVSINNVAATAISVWYDRWSGLATDLIHVAFTDQNADDTFYINIDPTNADALSARTTVFAGATTATGGALSISRARGGNIYVATMIDAGAEGGFFRSVDTGANWTTRATVFEAATDDQVFLAPGFAADNQDMIAIYLDASADEVSRKLYDDSGDAWAESAIATMVDVAATATYPHIAIAVDLTNSQILLAFWNAIDLLNADLLFYTVTESAITGKTNVVTDSTDDQGLVAIGIDENTEDWWVFYNGLSAGSQTWATAVGLYRKISTDDGATWGAETAVLPTNATYSITGLWVSPSFNTRWLAHSRLAIGAGLALASFEAPAPRLPAARMRLGM